MTNNSIMRSKLNALLDVSTSLIAKQFDRSCVVYGAGNFGRFVGDMLERAGVKISYFIDAQIKSDFPWPVYQFDCLDELNKDVDLVMGIFNTDVEISSLMSNLRKAGYQQQLTPVQFFQRISHLNPQRQYWLSTPSDYLQCRDEILSCVDLFSDEESKKIYIETWEYRLMGNIQCLSPHLPYKDQYFPSDILTWKSPLRFIDCGAYNGDTLLSIEKRQIPLAAAVAFEPDSDNFSKLARLCASCSSLRSSILFPCAVHSKTCLLNFCGGVGAASNISNQGNNTIIQAVCLDDCLPGFEPNLIKMDIEGAEIDALIGAEKTIKNYRPRLAICLYHTPHHIWQIPKLLHDWDLGYKFYIRVYGNQTFDTVLYALP